MATQPIGGETAHVTPAPAAQNLYTPSIGFAPMPAVAAVLGRYKPEQLASFIEVAIGLLDLAEPDPDIEDATDLEDDFALSPQAIGYASGIGCEVADTPENAWIEWDRMRGAQKTGHNQTAGQEDDEDGDSDRGLDEGEPDFARYRGIGAGCEISDPDFCSAGDDRVFSGATSACNHATDDAPGDPEDGEREQLLHDVPMLPVVTLNHNVFTDQRLPLGWSNLQSSFRCGADGVRSADSGEVFVPRHDCHDHRARPGVPV